MRTRSFWILAMCLLGVMHAQAATIINGAGATFPYPLYSKWFSEYQKINKGVQINYQSIGSGGGIRQFIDGTIDFGATDSPMTDEQLVKAREKGKGEVIHVPTVLGAVAVTYHLPGVSKGLKLSSDVVADIFLGKITKWNDPRIVSLNPGVKLPADAIMVARRSDGSGTTGIFTDYLSKVSPEWKQKVGAGTAVKWPVGLGGKGNEGVAGLIKQAPGTIGYVELIYAENNGLPYAAIKNSSGKFVAPELKSVTAAGALKNIPADFRVSITDASGKDAYPISGFTYLLIDPKMADKDKLKKLTGFISWALKDGQKMAESLFYAPLPKVLAEKAETKLKTLK